jgi:hypothetical protein
VPSNSRKIIEGPKEPSPKEEIRKHYAKIDRFNKRNSLGFLKEEGSMIIQKIFNQNMQNSNMHVGEKAVVSPF